MQNLEKIYLQYNEYDLWKLGLKDSGGDITKLGLVVKNAKNKEFQLLCGSASFLYAGLHVGAIGEVCALANVLGKECVEIKNLFD